jgi:hypothetical protein
MRAIRDSLNNYTKSIRVVLAAASLAFVTSVSSANVAAASPFAVLAGSWAGAGTIVTSGGDKERIRCRARYDVDGGGVTVNLTIRCAGDSFNFELQSNASHSNGVVSGTWNEVTRQVGGNIEGNARGGNINVRVSGIVSAMLAVITNANKQSISIEAPGTELQSVAISLSRK